MIVNKKKEPKEVKCLFEEFGKGVHLVKDKTSRSYELLVICNKSADVLFISDNNGVMYRASTGKKIPFDNFYEQYEYIKKLDPDELVVNVK